MKLYPFKPCLLTILLICGSDFATAQIFFTNGNPHVKLSNGAQLSGRLEYSRSGHPFNSFVGVPYGKIPGRFEEAQLAPAWDGIFNATKQGQACVQSMNVSGIMKTLGAEDCLNLNVYVPTNSTQVGESYPVIVMIHGGGYSVGSGFIMGPKYFMDENIIFLAMNYRLSAFGFLSTGDDVIPGNNGLKDQVLALRWIQVNIQNFGGDPQRVTVCGISAGGTSVDYLLVSPMTHGLFQRAIAQSGSLKSPWAYNPNPRSTAVKLATYLKCPTKAEDKLKISSEEIATCLKNLTIEELNDAQLKFSWRWPPNRPPYAFFEFGPVTETKHSKSPFFTDSPWNITKPQKKSIPIIFGCLQDEGVSMHSSVIFENQNLLDELNSNWEDNILNSLEFDRLVPVVKRKLVAQKIRKFYFGDKNVTEETRANLTNLYTDAFFVHPLRRTVIEIVQKGQNPYLYQYAYHGPAQVITLKGFRITGEDAEKVSHADDFTMHFNIDNLFPTFKDLVSANSSHAEFSKNFVKLWVSFAVHGKPTHFWGKFKEIWKPVSTEAVEQKGPLKWFRIDSNPGYVDDEEIMESFEFWERLYDDDILPYLPNSQPSYHNNNTF